MALISRTGSTHCIHSETIQHKKRHNGVDRLAYSMDTAKTKEISFLTSSAFCGSLRATQSQSLDGNEMGQRRWHRLIVAASPPTEDTAVAAEPLTKEDLVGYLASGCKPKEKWRFNF